MTVNQMLESLISMFRHNALPSRDVFLILDQISNNTAAQKELIDAKETLQKTEVKSHGY